MAMFISVRRVDEVIAKHSRFEFSTKLKMVKGDARVKLS